MIMVLCYLMSVLLHELLNLRGVKSTERILQQLLHLLQPGRQEWHLDGRAHFTSLGSAEMRK